MRRDCFSARRASADAGCPRTFEGDRIAVRDEAGTVGGGLRHGSVRAANTAEGGLEGWPKSHGKR